MMLINTGNLLKKLEEVRPLDNQMINEIENIITKPFYVSKDFFNPHIKIESYTGKIVNQQLVVVTFYELDVTKFENSPYKLYAYSNNGGYFFKSDLSLIKYAFLKESIMFDIYLSKNLFAFNKKQIIEIYKKYNENLLDEIESGRPIANGLWNVIDKNTYKRFLDKTVIEKGWKR